MLNLKSPGRLNNNLVLIFYKVDVLASGEIVRDKLLFLSSDKTDLLGILLGSLAFWNISSLISTPGPSGDDWDSILDSDTEFEFDSLGLDYELIS